MHKYIISKNYHMNLYFSFQDQLNAFYKIKKYTSIKKINIATKVS